MDRKPLAPRGLAEKWLTMTRFLAILLDVRSAEWSQNNLANGLIAAT
jgi:hypothetical protein